MADERAVCRTGRHAQVASASPHFGERWGRHWMDVARFAESSGGGRSLMFKNAWRYRDYVIAAYNKDGRISPEKFLETVRLGGGVDNEICLELSFLDR